MPKITDPKVLEILDDPYFDHHAAMHLARLRLHLPDGTVEKLFLTGPPCDECDMMLEAGTKGSGREFLDMHHEMIRVLRFLLDKIGMALPMYSKGNWQGSASAGTYSPLLWDLDDHRALPHEITGMLNVTDPEYLDKVFAGVKRRTGRDSNYPVDCKNLDTAIDELGLFMERGVDRKSNPKQPIDGSGFHNTMHEYLASREGKSAQGAEMNKLRNSMYNDYFWSLHIWMDGQYAHLMEACGKPFDTSPLDPAKVEDADHNHGMATGMMRMST